MIHRELRDAAPSFIAKVLVPRRGPDVIRRSRLLDLLAEGKPGTLTVVQAPAGYGKTTLLVDLCHEACDDVCWLSLDDWDRDPALFFQYLRLSVERAAFADAMTQKRRTTATDPRLALAEIADLVVANGRDTWIVLDDLQSIEDSSAVIELVDYFAQRLPPNCRLFLLSRNLPPLPSLPKLRLTAGVIELGPEQLAFTRDELEEYWQRKNRGLISPQQVDQVLTATQGWPAAVALIEDAGSLAEGLTSSLRHLSDYVSTEVFRRLSSEHQSFLLKTSVLETLEADACALLLDMSEDDAEKMLRTLPRLNIPVTPLGGTRSNYRIHPILRDFLLTELRRQGDDLYRTMQHRAAERCSARGRMRDAVWHFAEAEEWDAVVTTVLEEAPNTYRLGQWHTLMSWLDLIPVEESRRHAQLQLWEARILSRLGQTDEALRVIADGLASRQSPEAVKAEFEAVRAASLRVKGEVRAALQSAQRSYDLSIAGNAQIEVVAEARKELGLALMAAGSFSEAIEELRSSLGTYVQRGDSEASAFLNGCLGSALGAEGQLAESASYLEQARQTWRRLGNAKELSWVLNNLANTYANMGHEELARELFSECVSAARKSGNKRAEGWALESLATMNREAGLLTEAATMYREVLGLSADLGEMTLTSRALTGLAETERQLGRTSPADRWARQALASAQEHGGEFEQALAYVAIGRIDRARGALKDAVISFNTAADLFEKAGARKDLAECLLRLADALLPLRSNRILLKMALERIPKLVQAIGYDAFLVKQASGMTAVLEYAIAQRVHADFYRNVLKRVFVPSGPERPIGEDAKATKLPRVEVVALGRMDVLLQGRIVSNTEWQSEKSRELFLLMLTAGRPLRRDEIVATLWPESGGAKSVSAFHSTLHRTRRAVYPECISESRGVYQLNRAGSFESDVGRFQALAKRVRDTRPGAGEERHVLEEAVRLYGGAFAPAIDSEWADDIRRELEERFVEIAGKLAARFVEDRNYPAAISIYERILSYDPLNEPACHRALQCHQALGNAEAAATIYHRFRSLLEAEVGQELSPAIEELRREILRGNEVARPP